MHLEWSTTDLTLTFAIDDGPVRLTTGASAETPQPLVEVSAIGYGRSPGTNRHVDTILGKRLRYVSHDDTGSTLRIVQAEPETGLRVTSVFERHPALPRRRGRLELHLVRRQAHGRNRPVGAVGADHPAGLDTRRQSGLVEALRLR
jgi:hypothetical protein